MINLLPTDDRRNLRAAHANTLLFRYVVLLIIVLVGMALAFVAAYYVLSIERANAEETIRDNDIKEQKYAKVKQEAASFRADLTSARVILDKQIQYSQILLGIAKAMPAGTVLTDITLDPTLIGKPVDVKAKATDSARVVQLRNSLQDSGLFSDVHFTTVRQLEKPPDQYVFEVDMSVTFKREAIRP